MRQLEFAPGSATSDRTISLRRRVAAPAPRRDARFHTRVDPDFATTSAAEWDALTQAGDVPLRYGVLRAWEACELAGLQTRPIVLRDGSSSPVAACPGYLYDLDIATTTWPALTGAAAAVRRAWPRLLLARTYELGTPTPLARPFLVAPGQERQPAIEAMLEAALQEAERAEAMFVLVQNFASPDSPAAEPLRRRGFTSVPIPCSGVVDTPYDSFDEYLAAMRAPYRRRARQALKRSQALTVEHLEDFAEEAGELARLWHANYDRAREVRREVLTPEYFRQASSAAEMSVLAIRREDRSIASFALLLDDRPWLSFIQCGFELDAGREEGAYFRLLYEIIRLGIERGYEQVDLGITTLAPKLDVGAVPVPLYAWLRHRNRFVQRALTHVANGPLRPTILEPRNVFKEPPPEPLELVRRRGLGA